MSRMATASAGSYPLQTLAIEWSRAGRRLSPTHAGRCVVGGCYSMPFVALRTAAGSKAVCFPHYGLLDDATGLPGLTPAPDGYQ